MADQWFRLPASWAIQDDWLQGIGTIPRLLWPVLVAYIKGAGTGAVFSKPAPRIIAMQAGEGVSADHASELWDAAVEAGAIVPDGPHFRLVDRELVMSQDAIRKEQARASGAVQNPKPDTAPASNEADTAKGDRTRPDTSGQDRSTGQDRTGHRYSLEGRDSEEGESEGDGPAGPDAHGGPPPDAPPPEFALVVFEPEPLAPPWAGLSQEDAELSASLASAELAGGKTAYGMAAFERIGSVFASWRAAGLRPESWPQLAAEWRDFHRQKRKAPYTEPCTALTGNWLTNALAAQAKRDRSSPRMSAGPTAAEQAAAMARAAHRAMGGSHA